MQHHAIDESPQVQRCAHDDEAVPQHMVKAQPLPKLKGDARAVCHAPGQKQPQRIGRHHLAQRMCDETDSLRRR